MPYKNKYFPIYSKAGPQPEVGNRAIAPPQKFHKRMYLSGAATSYIISPHENTSLVAALSQCKYFSILADETIDVSQTEQLTLSVRFIKDTKVRRIFVLCSRFFNNRQRSCIYDSHPTISTWA